MNFKCLNKTPNEFYLYTLKSNVESISNKMLLRRGDDNYLWGCTSLEDIIKQFNATVLNPNYTRIDNNGNIETLPSTNKEDYVIIKVTPKYDTPQNWYKGDPVLPPKISESQAKDPFCNPYALSLAYQGNLRIGSIDIIPIP